MKSTDEMMDELFERREKYYEKKRSDMRHLKKFTGMLACSFVVLAAGILLAGSFVPEAEDNMTSAEKNPDMTIEKQPEVLPGQMASSNQSAADTNASDAIGNENTSNAEAKDNKVNGTKKEMAGDRNDDNASNTGIAENTVSEGTSVDLPPEQNVTPPPISDSPGNNGVLVLVGLDDGIWGGGYYDETGRLVILLTENTPENQRKVLELNPTLSETDIIFETAVYSEAYLTDLLYKASQALDVVHLPSGSSVGIRVDLNCIRVDVNSTMMNADAGIADSIAEILALDTQGGAIQIMYIGDREYPTESQKGMAP